MNLLIPGDRKASSDGLTQEGTWPAHLRMLQWVGLNDPGDAGSLGVVASVPSPPLAVPPPLRCSQLLQKEKCCGRYIPSWLMQELSLFLTSKLNATSLFVGQAELSAVARG